VYRHGEEGASDAHGRDGTQKPRPVPQMKGGFNGEREEEEGESSSKGGNLLHHPDNERKKGFLPKGLQKKKFVKRNRLHPGGKTRGVSWATGGGEKSRGHLKGATRREKKRGGKLILPVLFVESPGGSLSIIERIHR